MGGAATHQEPRSLIMSETNTTSGTGRKPSYVAYSVREREGKKARFTEIGVAFPHRDGKGFDILYDAIPLGGRITLRAPDANGSSAN